LPGERYHRETVKKCSPTKHLDTEGGRKVGEKKKITGSRSPCHAEKAHRHRLREHRVTTRLKGEEKKEVQDETHSFPQHRSPGLPAKRRNIKSEATDKNAQRGDRNYTSTCVTKLPRKGKRSRDAPAECRKRRSQQGPGSHG